MDRSAAYCSDRSLQLVNDLVTFDTVGDFLKASLPCFLVPAAAELSGHNVAESLQESINIFIWDVPLDVGIVSAGCDGLQRIRVIQEGHSHVDSSKHEQSKRAELSRRRILATEILQGITCFRLQVEQRSPDCFGEVFATVPVGVRSSPLTLHLNTRQDVALMMLMMLGQGRHSDQNNQSENDKLQHLVQNAQQSTSGQLFY